MITRFLSEESKISRYVSQIADCGHPLLIKWTSRAITGLIIPISGVFLTSCPVAEVLLPFLGSDMKSMNLMGF